MNNLRKNWNNNGKPFYFKLAFQGNVIKFTEDKCLMLDNILFDSDTGITLMDVLVEVSFLDRMLQRCTDKMVISSIKYELWQIASIVNQYAINYVHNPASNNK